ncbi:MAG: hypothetical protein A2355_06330 [Spirochaetes bacterium RIFOXYB1_FULL_32_8]|nr:MAG: hypothetical protein A2355_06330 [Spirochaetes bacterium RIFOXYB1_FULL_32_8]
MAKKTFHGKLARGKNPEDIINEIVLKGEQKTVEAIHNLDSKSEIKEVLDVIEIVEEDAFLSDIEKEDAIMVIEEKFSNRFNFDNCPSDYEKLKQEAKFLAQMTQKSFLLMAQRLCIIKSKKLYEKDGYKDFKIFVESELNISRQTVYKYLDILSFFGVAALRHQNLDYSKLIPVIPILRAFSIDEAEKEEIKKEYLQKAKTESFRDILKETADLKIQYGLVKQINYDANDIKKIKAFSEYLTKTEAVSGQAKAQLVELLAVIKKHVE